MTQHLMQLIHFFLPTGIFDIYINIIPAIRPEYSLQHIKIYLIVKIIMCLIERMMIQFPFIGNYQYPEMQITVIEKIINNIHVKRQFLRRDFIPLNLKKRI